MLSSPTKTAARWDVFISHASEDKAPFVRALARALAELGLSVFYDEFVLKPGDSIRRSLDAGLRSSEYVVVVLSPAYFCKEWTQKELDAAFSQETVERKVVVPVWLDVTVADVRAFSPLLAARIAVVEATPERAAQRIFETIRPGYTPGNGSAPSLETNIAVSLSVQLPSGESLRHRLEGRVLPVLAEGLSLLRDRYLGRTVGTLGTLPPLAVHEILVNAIAHRDYDQARPIEVELTANSLTVRNPGTLVPPLTVGALRSSGAIVLRNLRLARELVDAGFMEAFGAGLVRLRAALTSAGLAEAAFCEDPCSSTFSVTIGIRRGRERLTKHFSRRSPSRRSGGRG